MYLLDLISTKATNRPLLSSHSSVIESQNYSASKYCGGVIERIFLKIQSGRVKNYLWERRIQLSDSSKRKKKQNFFYLCKIAATMKQIKTASTTKDCR